MKRGRAIAVAGVAALAVAGVALANGTAQPDSVAFFADADAADDFALNTTFGFLFSEDAGETWEWTCHEAVIGKAPFTPASQRAPNGVYYVTTPLLLGTDPALTLWRSDDRGCSWTGNESLRNETARGIAFRPGDDTTAIVIGTRTGGVAAAWRSTDGALTFGAPLLEVPDHVFTTVHYAPSDPQRVYVAALKQTLPQAATLYRSDDGGDNWTPYPHTFPDQPPMRVLAVDPDDAETLWIRNDAALDRVYVSTNGGASLALAHTVDADIMGMALTDGGDSRWIAVSRTNGLLHATAADPLFEPVPGSPNARCVENEGDALYVCAHPYTDPYTVAVTLDGGATFDTAMTFQRITGPRSGCEATSAHVSICEPLWPAVQQNLGIGAATPSPTPTPEGNGGDDGCGGGCCCSLGEHPRNPSAGALALVSLVVLGHRRRARL